jgi:hypothetical protein
VTICAQVFSFFADRTERQVVMGTAQGPQISGRRAVWQQQAPGSWDIVMKDL